MKNYLGIAEFSERCGVSRQAIYKAIDAGTLAGAVVRSAGRNMIDLDHIEAMIYEARCCRARKIPVTDDQVSVGNDPQVVIDATVEDLKEAAAEIDDANLPSDPSEFLQWPLARLIEIFGTAPRLKDWLDARKKIADIKEKDLKNAVTEGKLADVKLFKRDIYPAIDACFIKILSDGAKTSASRAMAMAQAGKSVEELEQFIHDTMSTHIKVSKKRILRTLDSIETKAAKNQEENLI